jgi:hypothetical protein
MLSSHICIVELTPQKCFILYPQEDIEKEEESEKFVLTSIPSKPRPGGGAAETEIIGQNPRKPEEVKVEKVKRKPRQIEATPTLILDDPNLLRNLHVASKAEDEGRGGETEYYKKGVHELSELVALFLHATDFGLQKKIGKNEPLSAFDFENQLNKFKSINSLVSHLQKLDKSYMKGDFGKVCSKLLQFSRDTQNVDNLVREKDYKENIRKLNQYFHSNLDSQMSGVSFTF